MADATLYLSSCWIIWLSTSLSNPFVKRGHFLPNSLKLQFTKLREVGHAVDGVARLTLWGANRQASGLYNKTEPLSRSCCPPMRFHRPSNSLGFRLCNEPIIVNPTNLRRPHRPIVVCAAMIDVVRLNARDQEIRAPMEASLVTEYPS